MTRLLALDTSAAACSVALLQDTDIDEDFELAPRDHTRLILPMVDALLTRNNLSLGQLDGIAFGRGPGSFTGLRICAGVVQGLAFGAGLPVVAVSSLAAVARAFFEQQSVPPRDPALVCVDARMDELYFAAYEHDSGAGVALQGEEQLVAPGDLRLQGFKSTGSGLIALGSGWQFLPQMPDVTAADFAVINDDVLPRARHIAQLGALLLQRGEVLQPQQAEPVYLRQQVAWKTSAKALTKTNNTSKGG